MSEINRKIKLINTRFTCKIHSNRWHIKCQYISVKIR